MINQFLKKFLKYFNKMHTFNYFLNNFNKNAHFINFAHF